jgi:hypothetical protein
MKRILFISLIVFFVLACKKTEFSPEGPTDVRIKNLTSLAFYDLTVDIDTVVNYGTLEGQSTSEYVRFPRAYPKATISAKVNKGGSLVTFSTEKFDYTYMQYMGQMRITYEVYIPNMEKNEFKLEVVTEEALELK